mmetsp:Transcript_28634/g.13257  ORF Transcript_28634/g.13257 Transcript_28634/m.13257 type:complete len:93 (+) Transcript_28634:448-726(+)
MTVLPACSKPCKPTASILQKYEMSFKLLESQHQDTKNEATDGVRPVPGYSGHTGLVPGIAAAGGQPGTGALGGELAAVGVGARQLEEGRGQQ